MLAADARREALPEDAEFHEEELKSLDSSTTDLCVELLGRPAESPDWISPVRFAYERGYMKQDDMAWLKEFEQGLRLSKRYFENFLPLTQSEVHIAPDTGKISPAASTPPPSTIQTPKFYETPAFAIAMSMLSFSVAFVLTVLGVRMKNLSWLFVLAWVCAIPAVLILCRDIKNLLRRNIVRGLILILCAGVLYLIDRATRPSEGIPITIVWNAPAPISADTPLSKEQLNATATIDGKTVEGDFVYVPALGATLAPGVQTLAVKFTPRDPSAYLPKEKTVTIVVTSVPVGANTQVSESSGALSPFVKEAEFRTQIPFPISEVAAPPYNQMESRTVPPAELDDIPEERNDFLINLGLQAMHSRNAGDPWGTDQIQESLGLALQFQIIRRIDFLQNGAIGTILEKGKSADFVVSPVRPPDEAIYPGIQFLQSIEPNRLSKEPFPQPGTSFIVEGWKIRGYRVPRSTKITLHNISGKGKALKFSIRLENPSLYFLEISVEPFWGPTPYLPYGYHTYPGLDASKINTFHYTVKYHFEFKRRQGTDILQEEEYAKWAEGLFSALRKNLAN
jgi:hypothetical protein